MSKSFLNLKRDVVHVLGAQRSAIYDLRHKRIFSLDQETTTLLKSLLAGVSVARILSEHSDFRRNLDYLVKNDLVSIETASIDHNQHLKSEVRDPGFSIAWIELNTSCNHKCTHCYNFSGPVAIDDNRLSVDLLKATISELADVGVKAIKFIGGEPLILKEELRQLIRCASDLNFETVAVHTNGTLLSNDWLAFFSEHAVRVDVTVYGHTAELHDAATRTAGSFSKTIAGLYLVAEWKVPASINLVVMPHSEEFVPDIRAYYRREFPALEFFYDYIRPVGRAIDLYKKFSFNYLNRYREHESYFPGINREDYLDRLYYNPCLKDKIAISPSGETFPCMMTRFSSGNVRDQTISQIISSVEFRAFRELSLSKVEVCKDCEYRYACTDCRPIALGAGTGRYSKPPECKYDPYTGSLSEK